MSDIQIIKNRISRGRKFFENANESKYERFRNYLKINHYGDTTTYQDRVTVAYIHALLRAKLPFLYFRNPEVIAMAKRKIAPEKMQATLANIDNAQAIMDYFPDRLDIEKEVRLLVQDAYAFGRGVCKVGFEFEAEGLAPKARNMVQKTLGKAKQFLSGESQPNDEELKILVDRFYVRRVSFPKGDFIYDPNATRGLNDARWVAERIIEPLADVKKNPFFKNTSKLTTNCKINKDLNVANHKDDNGEEMLEYFHYWEKNRHGVVYKQMFVVPDQNAILREMANNYDHKDWPYLELDGYEISDELFPIGDIQTVETQQQQLDLLATIQTTHARSFIQKYIYHKGKIDENTLNQLREPVNSFVGVDEEAGLRPLENPTVNQTVPQTTEITKHDMTKIMAVSEYDTAVMPKTETTLGEARMVQGGANNRKEDSRKNVEVFMERLYNKLFAVIQQYLTEDMLVQVTGQAEFMEAWNTITPEQIQGDFDIKVVPYSASLIDKQALREQSLLLYEKFQADPTIPLEGRNRLRTWVLEAFDRKDASLFQTQINPNEPAPAFDEQGKPIDMAPMNMAPAEPPKEESNKQPQSVSVSFKDLPPAGQVQLAAQLGIEITEEDVINHQAFAKVNLNRSNQKGTK
jgi:hypothetical protein